jgi:hypothetical protein
MVAKPAETIEQSEVGELLGLRKSEKELKIQ